MLQACFAVPARARTRRIAAGARALLATLVVCTAAYVHPADLPGPEAAGGARLHGKFIWFELATDEPAAASRFYESVFGWRFRAVAGAPASYTIIESAGTRVAGMFERERPPGGERGALWLALISVSDPLAAVRYAEQNGGAVLAPAASFGGRGTHALLRDPEGAPVGVLRTQNGDPPDTPVADGDFFWVDLLARDAQHAAQFYAGLAGYEISERESAAGFTRLVLQSQGYARAGVVPLPQGLKQSGWLPYVLVTDVAATLQKVQAAQGTVLVQPRPELLDGNLAVIADPLGGVLGIVDWQGSAEGKGQ